MKLKFNNTYMLSACVVILAGLCIMSVASPMRFDHQRAVRERAVKTRLMKIRTAEEKYRIKHDTYTGNFKDLVREGYLADSLCVIPFTDSVYFSLAVSAVESKSGQQIPVMECSAEYKQYLHGLDETSVKQLTDDAAQAGRFPGLKIGDLETPNNNEGNW